MSFCNTNQKRLPHMMISFLSLVAMALLFAYQGAEGRNKTISYPADYAGPSVDGCICYHLGKTYNLGPLERDDGEPRFNASSSGQWKYSFNPCRSFSQGPPQQSDCFGDVAICRWPKNKANYQNIGKQTSVYCGLNKEFLTPQLVYTNKESFPEWKAVVNLKCDPAKKTADEADFDFISAANNIWEFLITSICACPDGCPSHPEDPNSAKSPADDANKLEYILPICALSFLVFAVPLFIYRHRIRQCIRGQNGNDAERQPFNDGHDGGDRADYAANQRNEPDNPHDVPQPSSASPSPSSHIVRPNKNFNVRGSRNQNA